MNQEVSKQKKNAKWLKAYIVSVHIVLFVMVLALTTSNNEKHTLTLDQMKGMAVGYSLAHCVEENQNKPSVDCESINLEYPIGHNTGWASDYPYWEVKYRTTKGEKVSGTVYIDRFGKDITKALGVTFPV